jgi:DNA-binding response OmpR family regulator
VSIKILVLEDDLLLGETLVDLLEDADMEVFHVTNGQMALDTTYKQNFDLYLLDINVPIIDGVTLLKELREANDNTPTIFLTSHKEKEMMINSFQSGADDFVTKPFDTDELIFRIEAILKRYKTTKLECINLLCHDELHQCILYDSKELELAKKEYLLLLLLMSHVDKVVPRNLIIGELWSSSEDASDGAIRVYINRLKKLLVDMDIENIRGVGYRLVS